MISFELYQAGKKLKEIHLQISNRGYAVPNLTETRAKLDVPNVRVDVVVDRCSSDGVGGLLPATAG